MPTTSISPRQQDALPAYLFHQGTNFRAYVFLGVLAICRADGKTEYTFRRFYCVACRFFNGARKRRGALCLPMYHRGQL